MRAARWLAVLLAAAGGAILVLIAVSGMVAWLFFEAVAAILTGEERFLGHFVDGATLVAAMAASALAGAVVVARRPLLAAALIAVPILPLLLRARVDPHPIILTPAALLLAAALAALWSARRA